MSTRTNRHDANAPVVKPTGQAGGVDPPAWAVRPDVDNAVLSVEASARDWEDAMETAADRLNDGWVLPETRCRPTATGVVEELSNLLCAYGMTHEEAEPSHTESHQTALPLDAEAGKDAESSNPDSAMGGGAETEGRRVAKLTEVVAASGAGRLEKAA